MIALASVPQLDTTERREYEQDKKTVLVGRPTLLEFLRHSRERASAVKGMKRTALTAGQVAEALWRMKVRETYREEFDNFSALCRHLKINRQEAIDTINLVDVTNSLPPETLAKMGGKVTRRQAKLLRHVPLEERAALIDEAAELQAAPVGLDALRARLRERALTNEALKDGEVAKQPAKARSLHEQFGDLIARFRKLAPRLTTAQQLVMHLDALQLAVTAGEPVPDVRTFPHPDPDVASA